MSRLREVVSTDRKLMTPSIARPLLHPLGNLLSFMCHLFPFRFDSLTRSELFASHFETVLWSRCFWCGHFIRPSSSKTVWFLWFSLRFFFRVLWQHQIPIQSKFLGKEFHIYIQSLLPLTLIHWRKFSQSSSRRSQSTLFESRILIFRKSLERNQSRLGSSLLLPNLENLSFSLPCRILILSILRISPLGLKSWSIIIPRKRRWRLTELEEELIVAMLHGWIEFIFRKLTPIDQSIPFFSVSLIILLDSFQILKPFGSCWSLIMNTENGKKKRTCRGSLCHVFEINSGWGNASGIVGRRFFIDACDHQKERKTTWVLEQWFGTPFGWREILCME